MFLNNEYTCFTSPSLTDASVSGVSSPRTYDICEPPPHTANQTSEIIPKMLSWVEIRTPCWPWYGIVSQVVDYTSTSVWFGAIVHIYWTCCERLLSKWGITAASSTSWYRWALSVIGMDRRSTCSRRRCIPHHHWATTKWFRCINMLIVSFVGTPPYP